MSICREDLLDGVISSRSIKSLSIFDVPQDIVLPFLKERYPEISEEIVNLYREILLIRDGEFREDDDFRRKMR